MHKFRKIRTRKFLLTTSFSLFISLITWGQVSSDSNRSNFWNNVQFGGGIGLSFGDGFFSGTLAPIGVYRFSTYAAAGVGLNATYSRQRDVFKSTILGGSLIGLFNPIQEIQLSTEFEQLYVSRDFDERFVLNEDDDYWYPAIFLGAGYTTGSITVGVRYDILYDENKSIYANAWMPFFRVLF